VFYLIDADTGLLVGNPSGSACSGTGCLDVGLISNPIKNAIQADVTASGAYNSPVVTRAYVGDLDGRYWRMDLTATGGITQTLMLDSGQPIYSSSAMLFVGSADRYLFFGTGSDILAAQTPGGSGTFKLYGLKDGSSTPVFAKSLAAVSGAATASPTNGERPTSAPTVAGDIVFFTTTTDSATVDCVTEALSKLYAFTYLGSAAYDSNGNGNISNNESPIVSTSQGRATAPFIVDQHLFMSTTRSIGVGVVILGDSEDFNNGVGQIGLRILSWREIR
jgi:Tfp pilus tip-associated adhesin PilY1